MSNKLGKIQKNAENFMVDQFYKNMTPEQYKMGINNAIKLTEERLTKEYNTELKRMGNEYNNAIAKYNDAIQNEALIAMDTLAVEIIYELGRVLECYVDEPENLDQKIDVVQNIYETAMKNISDYASSKYKNDKQAQKVFEKKKRTIQKLFGMEAEDGTKKS